MKKKCARLAILDMYESTVNLGMRNIQEIVTKFQDELDVEIFDVRSKVQVPDLNFDIYIFSGGPGNPLVGDEIWLQPFHDLIDKIWSYNLSNELPKKFVFFICHSFQMACHHFGLGEISRRRKKSFGTFPVNKTADGVNEMVFKGLGNPFWIADFREFQVVQPNFERLKEIGAKLLCIEKERAHVGLERAMMAVRFSNEMIGTQFHPEADPEGMRVYFQEEERIKAVVEEYGKAKLKNMIEHLSDENKIHRTHAIVLPSFIRSSLDHIKQHQLLTV
jgi:GMP synthase-like glutamine amidotransferase